ncbi:MAG: TlpA disulfide reductase family protein [Gammaproteobacteria bacterium]
MRRSLCALVTSLACALACAADVGVPAPACAPLAAARAAHGLDGKVIVVDFWASWCPPCRKLMPFLDDLYGSHRDDGLAVIAINVDEVQADAERFLARRPVSYPVAFDAAGECPRAFALAGMPSTYVLDRAGVVRLAHAGYRRDDEAALAATVTRLLAE